MARKQLELDSKLKQIFKLELEISKVKFSAYKSKPNLKYVMWQNKTFLQQLASLHPPRPQFQNLEINLRYSGMPKPPPPMNLYWNAKALV